MGEPMDRSGRVFLGSSKKFEDAYPDIEDAILVWRETGEGVYNFGPGTGKRKASLKQIGGLLHCSNPRCRRGGYEIDVNILMDMTIEKQTEKNGSMRCPGDEGSPKGRRPGRRCLNKIDYTLTVKYRNIESPPKP
jgi:hypothetical protein